MSGLVREKSGLSADEDDLLLQQLRAENKAAFAQLVNKYHRKLWVVARAIVGELWAEEVVQDSWLSVHRSLHKFEGRSTLQTWLFTIVKNQAKTRLRTESRTYSDSSSFAASRSDESTEHRFRDDGQWQEPPGMWEIDSPAALLEEQQLKKCIQHTLDLLRPDQLAVFTMRDMQNMSFDDICNILDLSNSNARVLLHRARLVLMQVIERYQETGVC